MPIAFDDPQLCQPDENRSLRFGDWHKSPLLGHAALILPLSELMLHLSGLSPDWYLMKRF